MDLDYKKELVKKSLMEKVVVKREFFLNNNETEKTLRIKTQKLEYLAYPEAIISIFKYC